MLLHNHIRHYSLAAVIGLSILSPLAYPAQQNALPELEDLLQQRWYAVEVIIFERLRVLENNTGETLTLTNPRLWPVNLTLLSSTAASSTTVQLQDLDPTGLPLHNVDPDQVIWLTDSEPDQISILTQLGNRDPDRCIGFPDVLIPDPAHPSLTPPSPAALLAEQQRLELQAELAALERARKAEFTAADTQLQDDLDTHSELALSTEIEVLPEDLALVDPLVDDLVATDPAVTNQAPIIIVDPLVEANEALLAAVHNYEQQLYTTHFVHRADLQLTAQVKAINRRSHLRPLLHLGWRQAVPPRGQAQPIMVATAEQLDQGQTIRGLPKLQGYLALSVGRYLHFSTNLWYQADTLGLMPITLPYLATENSLPQPSRAFMALNESRRMRSGELHYIDHPKFGVIVRVDPVEIPTELVELHQSVTELVSQSGQ